MRSFQLERHKGIALEEAQNWQSRFRSPAMLLLACLIVGFMIREIVALYYPSLEWGDEIFNSLEPAHRLAYGYGIVVWEWREGVRSWVFPAFLAGVMRITDRLGLGSAGYLRSIATILSLLSLTTVWFAYAWAKRASGTTAAALAAATCALWYDLIYFAPKAFNEVIATTFLLPGLYLVVYPNNERQQRSLFMAGFLLGMAAAVRMELAPTVMFMAVYGCRRYWKTGAAVMLTGIAFPVLVFGAVDALTW